MNNSTTISEEKNIRAVIVGIELPGQTGTEASIEELARLIDTAGGECIAALIQNREAPDVRTCIGKGKIEELKDICEKNEISLVVFDCELSPSQIRNVEEELGGPDVIDRSMLILDIFALHAVSGEGKLQVELAQLKYSAPRLMGKGKDLSRLGGGIGTRGPGESKLESDRRHLKERVVTLERRLAELEHNRSVMRAHRDKSGIVKIALVGYTNSGKSTLLNKLTDAGVLSEDKLFATLDPTTRKLALPSGEEVLLTDTVGFIRKLPHHLVKAFKSTLDEVAYADILLLVSDITDPETQEHIEVTKEVISDLGASDKPTIFVYNKLDKLEDKPFVNSEDSVAVSAVTGEGIEDMLFLIENAVHKQKRKYDLLIPYTDQSALGVIYKSYSTSDLEYRDDGIFVRVVLDARGEALYSKYRVG